VLYILGKAPQPLAPTVQCADAEQKIVHVITVFELSS